MQLRRPAGIYQVFLMGVLVLATIVFTGRQHYGEAHNADEDQHAHHQTKRVCRGFVVLPNGFAVLSSLPLSPAYASVGERQMHRPFWHNYSKHRPYSRCTRILTGLYPRSENRAAGCHALCPYRRGRYPEVDGC